MCLENPDRLAKKVLKNANALYVELISSRWSLVEMPENGRRFITLFVEGMTNADKVVVETNAPGRKEEVALEIVNRYYFKENLYYDIIPAGEKTAGLSLATTLKVSRNGESISIQVAGCLES